MCLIDELVTVIERAGRRVEHWNPVFQLACLNTLTSAAADLHGAWRAHGSTRGLEVGSWPCGLRSSGRPSICRNHFTVAADQCTAASSRACREPQILAAARRDWFSRTLERSSMVACYRTSRMRRCPRTCRSSRLAQWRFSKSGTALSPAKPQCGQAKRSQSGPQTNFVQGSAGRPHHRTVLATQEQINSMNAVIERLSENHRRIQRLLVSNSSRGCNRSSVHHSLKPTHKVHISLATEFTQSPSGDFM